MNDYLHIVCLDAPSPPDYGGAIDMYFKAKALALTGKKVILHYFDYKENRGAGALKDVCAEVYSYPRRSFIKSISASVPYIVASRINKELVERLNRDDHPVLLEGLHCTGIVPMLNNPSRVLVRMHNEEENYYRSLYRSTNSIIKKTYFSLESKLIAKYQRRLDRNLKLACLSETDIEKFRAMGFSEVHFIPCFIPWRHTTSLPGKGSFCLYHGNLSIAENELSANWLIENIFSKSEVPFVIAGNRVSAELEKKAAAFSHIRIVKDPPIDVLEDLIKEAHINVLPSMNRTGVKLKLLHALFGGRFCITNQEGIKGSGISNGVHVADDPGVFRRLVEDLMSRSFHHIDIEARRDISRTYNNLENAKQLSALW